METGNHYHRPSWDEYFIKILEMVGSRGTCDRGRSGCVITKDRRIISTGYVGSPIGISHCDEVGHEMHTVTHEDGHQTRHCIRTTHAEQNAICQAARVGVALEGATLYCKMTPCYTCAKMIINAGITRVVAEQDYHASARSKEIFAEAGIQFKILKNEVTRYADMAPAEPAKAAPAAEVPVSAPQPELIKMTIDPIPAPVPTIKPEPVAAPVVEPPVTPPNPTPAANAPLVNSSGFTPISQILKADLPL